MNCEFNFAIIQPSADDTCEFCDEPAFCTFAPLDDDNRLSDDLNDHIHCCLPCSIDNFAALIDHIDA